MGCGSKKLLERSICIGIKRVVVLRQRLWRKGNDVCAMHRRLIGGRNHAVTLKVERIQLIFYIIRHHVSPLLDPVGIVLDWHTISMWTTYKSPFLILRRTPAARVLK